MEINALDLAPQYCEMEQISARLDGCQLLITSHFSFKAELAFL